MEITLNCAAPHRQVDAAPPAMISSSEFTVVSMCIELFVGFTFCVTVSLEQLQSAFAPLGVCTQPEQQIQHLWSTIDALSREFTVA